MDASPNDSKSYHYAADALECSNRRAARRRPRFVRRHVAPIVRRRLDPDADRTPETERAQLAASIDGELRVACGSEAAARHELGRAAHALLACRGYQRLGFVRLNDYARERLGVSARTLQSAAWVATRLDALRGVQTAFDRSELSWAQVRALCAVATAETEAVWLERARRSRAHDLETLAKASASDHPSEADPETDDGLIDGEPGLRFRIACPARVRALWRHALELASRMTGSSLVPWRAAEVIAAEAFSGRPSDMPFGERALLAAMAVGRRARREEKARAREARAGNAAGGDAACDAAGDSAARDGGLSVPASVERASGGPCATSLAATPADTPPRFRVVRDPFALDARLCDAMRTIRTAEPRIGELLRLVVDLKLYRTLGFARVDGYVVERLGISPRKAWALLKVEKTARRTAAFARQYRDGVLPWTRTLMLLPVVDRMNEEAWLARAAAVTAQRLGDEVDFVLEQRDAVGSHVALDPPPLDATLASPVAEMLARECRKLSPAAIAALAARQHAPVMGRLQDGARASGLQTGTDAMGLQAGAHGLQNGAPVFEVCDVAIQFTRSSRCSATSWMRSPCRASRAGGRSNASCDTRSSTGRRAAATATRSSRATAGAVRCRGARRAARSRIITSNIAPAAAATSARTGLRSAPRITSTGFTAARCGRGARRRGRSTGNSAYGPACRRSSRTSAIGFGTRTDARTTRRRLAPHRVSSAELDRRTRRVRGARSARPHARRCSIPRRQM